MPKLISLCYCCYLSDGRCCHSHIKSESCFIALIIPFIQRYTHRVIHTHSNSIRYHDAFTVILYSPKNDNNNANNNHNAERLCTNQMIFMFPRNRRFRRKSKWRIVKRLFTHSVQLATELGFISLSICHCRRLLLISHANKSQLADDWEHNSMVKLKFFGNKLIKKFFNCETRCS